MRRIVAALVLCLPALPVLAEMRTEPVAWEVDGEPFEGALVYDDASTATRPGLVMVPNWMGVGEHAIAKASQIAGQDHVVLVVDVYGKGVRPKNADEARAQVGRAYADGGASLRARAAQAVEVLKAQADRVPLDPQRIGALGFCFGGSVALELARDGAELAGIVSFHGGLKTYLPGENNRIGTSVLVLNGADDTSVPDEDIRAFEQEMDAAGADWQFVNFSGARHCFAQEEDADNPPDSNCRYDARAAKRSMAMMRLFFAERFGNVR
ncbi:dienelactone hydrolase family protein [Marilutibacter alkalisoli]|uniref:Dienelactone hydrolase family protein n=1 Tax=Marilutibacter alkalisoli TaxID=2591633 RepID=A0A514BPT3_9GAMM|nr:dienelactone hydrolase family protein [Lysobacter alkalisoli]QDH69391.1 dienelactone hydrolase family protein [Lysobacter alkalisoli]